MRFEFATTTRIVFGPGSLDDLGAIARPFGQRALIVLGRSSSRSQRAIDTLEAAGIASESFHVDGEPTLDAVRSGVDGARAAGAEVVIGFGGGSAIDAAKAIAAILANGGDPLDYLEVIGRGRPLERASAPFIAIPTTAGAGAEVTRNAVLTSPEHRVKASMRSASMLAKVAIVDPDLLIPLLPEAIAASGLDAFSQLVEPFVSLRANPMIDALCREGLVRSARSLRRAFAGDLRVEIREDLALASLFGGLALANAGLGAVHGFAAPIGGMFPAPHGAVCAALLPHVIEANVRALERRAPESPALARYGEIASILTGRADAHAGVEAVRDLVRALAIPGLARYGIAAGDVPALVAKAKAASSMRGNPIALSDEELAAVVTSTMQKA